MLAQQGSSSSQVVLRNPFPQGQQLIVGTNENIGASFGGIQEGENTSNIYRMSSHVDISMFSRDYGEVESSKAKGTTDSVEPLRITNPTIEPILQMPKES